MENNERTTLAQSKQQQTKFPIVFFLMQSIVSHRWK